MNLGSYSLMLFSGVGRKYDGNGNTENACYNLIAGILDSRPSSNFYFTIDFQTFIN